MLNDVITIEVRDFLIVSGVIFAFFVLKVISDSVNAKSAKGSRDSNNEIRYNHVKGVPIKKYEREKDDFDEFMEWDLMGMDDDDIDGMWD